MKIPIRVYVDLHERIEDTLIHTLEVSVIGTKASATIAIVESDFYKQARITAIEKNGLNVLDNDLRDRFLVKLFRMSVGEMIAAEGSAITWDISDLSNWIGKQFSARDAAALEDVLAGFKRPDVAVIDRIEVRVD